MSRLHKSSKFQLTPMKNLLRSDWRYYGLRIERRYIKAQVFPSKITRLLPDNCYISPAYQTFSTEWFSSKRNAHLVHTDSLAPKTGPMKYGSDSTASFCMIRSQWIVAFGFMLKSCKVNLFFPPIFHKHGTDNKTVIGCIMNAPSLPFLFW